MKVKLFERYEIKKPNQEDIDEIESLLVEELYKEFPDSYYTTMTTKWNDGTFMVEVRHAENPIGIFCKIHHWTWYEGDWKHTMDKVRIR